MAQFACSDCDYVGHFVEFKVDVQIDSDSEDDGDEQDDALLCPECGSESAYEL
jgi:rubredoxin